MTFRFTVLGAEYMFPLMTCRFTVLGAEYISFATLRTFLPYDLGKLMRSYICIQLTYLLSICL